MTIRPTYASRSKPSKTSRSCTRLEVARDGDEAVSLLRDAIAGLGIPVPDLILLDLNLPKKDGREVLAEIKADPSLRRIPVVVLTTSRAEDDVLRCYDLHANCYVIKPIDFEEYVDVVRSIEAFLRWSDDLDDRKKNIVTKTVSTKTKTEIKNIGRILFQSHLSKHLIPIKSTVHIIRIEFTTVVFVLTSKIVGWFA